MALGQTRGDVLVAETFGKSPKMKGGKTVLDGLEVVADGVESRIDPP